METRSGSIRSVAKCEESGGLLRPRMAEEDLPCSTVCLAGQVYRAVKAEGSDETRFSLTNADGFFFVKAKISDLSLGEKEEILVVGRLAVC